VLHVAIKFQQHAILRKLLAEFPEEEAKGLFELPETSEGKTPLLLAASEGNGEALLLLQQRGVPMGQADSQGRTALHWAALGRHRHIIDLLAYFNNDLLYLQAMDEEVVTSYRKRFSFISPFPHLLALLLFLFSFVFSRHRITSISLLFPLFLSILSIPYRLPP